MIHRALFMVFVALCFNATAVLGQGSAPEPAFKEGDYWKFDYKIAGGASKSTNLPPGTYTVVFKNGKLLIEGSDTARSGLDVFGLAVPGLVSQWYNFPLEIGKRWNREQKLGGTRRSFVRYSDFTVEKADKITVAGGTFEVLKMTRTTRQTTGESESVSETVYYYSPVTKSAVKATYSGVSGENGELTLLEYGNKP